MDGYVNGNTAFKNTIYGFLSDVQLKSYGLTGAMNLYFINRDIHAFPQDLRDFIQNLNVNGFRTYGGKRSTSDIAMLLDTVLDKMDDRHVSVFISDCVFSPGSGKNAGDYLANQQNSIKLSFDKYLSTNPDLTTVVVKLKSDFLGKYYNAINTPQDLAGAERPYYIWLLGKSENIQQLLSKTSILTRDKVQNFYSFTPLSTAAAPAHQILTTDKIGNFELNRDKKDAIQDAQAEKRDGNRGKFQMAIGINLSSFGADTSYLADPANYKLSTADFTVRTVALSEIDKQEDPALSDFTHKILLSTNNLRTQTLDISLRRLLPNWVVKTHSMNDDKQAGAELNRTYGFKYLIDGVNEAYRAAADNQDAYFKLSIDIKK
jgi:hypothetical protein